MCPHSAASQPATTLRKYQCLRCNSIVFICSRCDRDHKYCASECSQSARRESLRRASRRYQLTTRGIESHRRRQRLYRKQNHQRVTHHTSPPAPVELPSGESIVTDDGVIETSTAHQMRCHFCHLPSKWFCLRRNSYRSRIQYRYGRRREKKINSGAPPSG